MALATGRSAPSIERLTRPLIADVLVRRWPSRNGDRELRPEHYASFIPALAAPSLDDVVATAELAEKMVLKVDRDVEGDSSPCASPTLHGCSFEDATFPWLTHETTLHNFLICSIADLMAQQPAEREARAARLDAAGWTLTISFQERWASVSWAEMFSGNLLMQPYAVAQSMLWQVETRASSTVADWRTRGVLQTTQIPIAVLLAAAETCDASYLTRTKLRHEKASKPARGGAGKVRATSPRKSKRKKLEVGEGESSPTSDDRRPTQAQVSAVNKRSLQKGELRNQLSLLARAGPCPSAKEVRLDESPPRSPAGKRQRGRSYLRRTRECTAPAARSNYAVVA